MCSDAEVRANALKSFLLNGISLLSVYAFDILVRALASGGEGGDSDPSERRVVLSRFVDAARRRRLPLSQRA